MYKAYRFRLYPNDSQRTLIHKTFGCVRFVYNYFLDKCKKNGYIKAYDMCKELKKLQEEYLFLKEVDSFSNFFAKRSGYPCFKNKFSKQSYRTNCIRRSNKSSNYSNIAIFKKNSQIKLPKLGLVNIKGYRNLESINGKIINATIERECTGKYYVSVVVEETEIVKSKKIPTSIVGIDLGVKDLVITSEGKKYFNPKELLKREKQLKRLQRKISRKVKGSKNYAKTKIRIARVHSKIRNSRKHNIINIVNDIVKNNDIIVSENLNVKGMSKNHNLAKSIIDASFNMICNMLKWKTTIQGKYYYQVDTFYPSSKTCSRCGNKTNITNNLSVRKWTCENCGNENDRDINASINIMFEGLKIHYKTI